MTRLEKRNAEIREGLDLIFDYDEAGLDCEEIPARELISELMGRSDAYHLIYLRAIFARNIFSSSFVDSMMMMCAEEEGVYGKKRGLIEVLVDEGIRENDGAFLALMRAKLHEKQDSYDVKGIILKIDQWGLRQLGECAVPSKGGLSPEAVRGALMVLFACLNKEGKRLFSKANHWVAVFRVMVDEELVADNAFEVFAKYIDGLMIENVPYELNTNNLSHSYDGVYRRPLKDWSVEAYLRWKGTGAKTKIFDDMYEVATKFRSLLDERRKKTA